MNPKIFLILIFLQGNEMPIWNFSPRKLGTNSDFFSKYYEKKVFRKQNTLCSDATKTRFVGNLHL